MLLSIGHRLVLLNILPPEGDITTLRIVRELRTALSFSEVELKEKQIVRNGDTVRWTEELDKPVDVPVGEKAFDIIKVQLESYNSQKRLRPEFLPLYEYFVEGKEWEV